LFLQFLLDGSAIFRAIRVRVFAGEAKLFAEGGNFGFEAVYDCAEFGFVEDFGDLWAGLDRSGALSVLARQQRLQEMVKCRSDT
jgi:hypothetical protein